MNLTKIEVLLDKIALLQETLTGNTSPDTFDLHLLKKYAQQLAEQIDEQLGITPEAPIEQKAVTIEPVEDADDMPSFDLQLEEADENQAEEDESTPSQPETITSQPTQEPVPSFSFYEDEEEEPETSTPEPSYPPDPVLAVPPTSQPLFAAEEEEDDSLNERFKAEDHDLLDKLKKQPIRSLKQEIDLNQKFWFTNELLQGDGKRFNDLLDQLDRLPNRTEATALLSRELALIMKEEEKAKAVQKFMELVDRRFMS